MLSRRAIREMLIAVGVAAGVVAVAAIGLIFAAPRLFPAIQQAPGPAAAQVVSADHVCTMDRKTVFEQTRISRDAFDQFVAIQKKMQAAIVAEKTRIDATAESVEEAQQLTARLQQRLAAENARLDVVRGAAMALVIKRVSPVIAQVGEAAKCSSVMDRANFIYVGSTKDLTDDIVTLVERDIPNLQPGTVVELYKNQK